MYAIRSYYEGIVNFNSDIHGDVISYPPGLEVAEGFYSFGIPDNLIYLAFGFFVKGGFDEFVYAASEYLQGDIQVV